MLPSPELFGVTYDWYTLWHKTALVITILFMLFYIKYKKPIQLSISSLLCYAVFYAFLGYIGARLFSVIDLFTDTGVLMDKAFIFNKFTSGRLRWYGALLFIILGSFLLHLVFKISKSAKLLDALVVIICLFSALVKQACLFSGDGCYGTYTNLPWGMYFPYGNAPNILPVHPTPLYDTLFHLGLFGFLYYWNQTGRKAYSGQVALFFFLGTSVFNFGLEFIRINPQILVGLTLAQLSYLLIFGLSYCYYFSIINKAQISHVT